MLKVYSTISLDDFKAWSGAVDTLDRIREEGKIEECEQLILDCFGDEIIEDTKINDFLWFDRDWIYETLEIEED